MQRTNLTVQKVEDYVNSFPDAVDRVCSSSITDHAKLSLSSSAK